MDNLHVVNKNTLGFLQCVNPFHYVTNKSHKVWHSRKVLSCPTNELPLLDTVGNLLLHRAKQNIPLELCTVRDYHYLQYWWTPSTYD